MLQAWTHKGWAYVFYALSAVNTVITCAGWGGWDWDRRLIGIAFIILAVHVSEEWYFPGGFHVQYNTMRGSSRVDRYPMDRLTDSTTVLVAMALGLVFIPLGGGIIMIAIMAFALFEVIGHTLMGIRMYRDLAIHGKKTIYGPGTSSAYGLYLPLAIIIACYAVHTGMGVGEWILGILCGLACVAAAVIIPELAMRNENSLYPYTDPGYYRRYPEALRGAAYPLNS